MDLSSLFGPPIISFNQAQLARINELASQEGVTGIALAGFGPGIVSVVVQHGNFEGARAVPTESYIDNDEQVIVDFYGNTYPGTEEAWSASLDQAEAAVEGLLDEVSRELEATLGA